MRTLFERIRQGLAIGLLLVAASLSADAAERKVSVGTNKGKVFFGDTYAVKWQGFPAGTVRVVLIGTSERGPIAEVGQDGNPYEYRWTVGRFANGGPIKAGTRYKIRVVLLDLSGRSTGLYTESDFFDVQHKITLQTPVGPGQLGQGQVMQLAPPSTSQAQSATKPGPWVPSPGAKLSKDFTPISVSLIGERFYDPGPGGVAVPKDLYGHSLLLAKDISVDIVCEQEEWVKSAKISSQVGGTSPDVEHVFKERHRQAHVDFPATHGKIADGAVLGQTSCLADALSTNLGLHLPIRLVYTCERLNPASSGEAIVSAERTAHLGTYPVTLTQCDQRRSIPAVAEHKHFLHKCPPGHELKNMPGKSVWTDQQSNPHVCVKR